VKGISLINGLYRRRAHNHQFSVSTSENGGAPLEKKKAKRSNRPVAIVSAEARAKQFEHLQADGGVLFCRYCSHSVEVSNSS